jgi:hypothetical protein
MPSFQINDSFAIESRSLFVLVGSTTAGTIKPGMLVRIPLNGSLSMTASIESIDSLKREGGREYTVLCIRISDADGLSLWRGLNIGGEAIDVVEEA